MLLVLRRACLNQSISNAPCLLLLFSFSLLLSSLELSDTQVYEPEIRALLGADSHFCKVVVPKRTLSGWTGPRQPARSTRTGRTPLSRPRSLRSGRAKSPRAKRPRANEREGAARPFCFEQPASGRTGPPRGRTGKTRGWTGPPRGRYRWRGERRAWPLRARGTRSAPHLAHSTLGLKEKRRRRSGGPGDRGIKWGLGSRVWGFGERTDGPAAGEHWAEGGEAGLALVGSNRGEYLS